LEHISSFSLPFRLFEINTGTMYLAFELKTLDSNTSDQSIKPGTFECIYRCQGMDCRFPCTLSIESLYYFYLSLDTAYDIEFSKNAKAVLDADNKDSTHIEFAFDDKCRCTVSGRIQNKAVPFQSGITVSFPIEQSDVCDVLTSMESFFRAWKLQGGTIL
jgi:hypothetical protein